MHLKPTAGCQISTLIFGFGGTLCIFHEKLTKDGKVLCHSGLMSKVFPRRVPDLSAWLKCSINIPWKIYQGRQSSCPLWAKIKGIARVFNWLKCLGGIMHLKPEAVCQISILIFEAKLWREVSINIPLKIYQGRQCSCPLWAKIKDIARVFNWLKCLGGIMHLKPTAGC